MDCITLKNMVFYGYHGVLPAEQELGQRFFVDVRLSADLRAAGQTDDLQCTINYAAVYSVVKEIVENRRFLLLEAVAESIAREILAGFPVEQVEVAVRKPSAPVAGVLDYAEVSIARRRQS